MLTLLKQKEEKWEIDGEAPRISITRNLLNKMFAYAVFAKGEISGLGEVAIEDGKIKIVDICLLKQECGGATTDIDATALAKWNLDMIQAGKDTQKWRVWWHSHADMDVFFSGTDVQCAKDLLNCFGDFVVSVVVNRKGEVYSRLNYTLPPQSLFSKFAIVCENTQMYVEDTSTIDTEDIKREIAEKVEEVSFTSSRAEGYSYSEEPIKSGHWDGSRQKYVHDKRSDLVWCSEKKKWLRDPQWQKEGTPGDIEDTPPPEYALGVLTPSAPLVQMKCEGCGEIGRVKYHFEADILLCKKCRKDWHYQTRGGGRYYGVH